MSSRRTLDRRAFLGALGSAVVAGLTACGSDNPSAERSGDGSPANAKRSVRHKYGTTTVPADPKRVVTLGYTDQEPFLALDVRPVGVVDFFEERPYGKWPWEMPMWADDKPTIVGKRDDYRFEEIARLKPDLIVGLYSGMKVEDYRKLSAFAPTVAQPTGFADFSAPWPVQTEVVGRCLGREGEARSKIKAIQARFAAERAAHPDRKGKTVAVVEPFQADKWAVFGASDPKVRFFQDLGYTVAPSVRRLEPGGDVAQLSVERLDVLDVDLLVLLLDPTDQTEAQVRANKLFQKLTVAREKRALFLPFSPNPPIGAALAFNSVLSIPYALKTVPPRLRALPT